MQTGEKLSSRQGQTESTPWTNILLLEHNKGVRSHPRFQS